MFSFKLTETSKRQLTLRFFLKQNPSLIFSTMTALLCSASLKSLLLLLGYKGSVLRQLCYVTRIVTFQKTVLKMWMNSWLERERACSCLQSGESWDAAKPHPNFPRHWAADNRAQRQFTLPAGLIQKHQVWLPLWHGPSLIQFNSVQQLAGTVSNKTQTTERKGGVRHNERMRGTMPTWPV